MIRSDTRKKLEFCQSKHYKSWNPDTLAEYSRSEILTINSPLIKNPCD